MKELKSLLYLEKLDTIVQNYWTTKCFFTLLFSCFSLVHTDSVRCYVLDKIITHWDVLSIISSVLGSLKCVFTSSCATYLLLTQHTLTLDDWCVHILLLSCRIRYVIQWKLHKYYLKKKLPPGIRGSEESWASEGTLPLSRNAGMRQLHSTSSKWCIFCSLWDDV